jgi:putative FmdB family regulatory protein
MVAAALVPGATLGPNDMPIYELRCADCGRLTNIFTRSVSAPFEQRCKHCGGERVLRVPPRVAYHRGHESLSEREGVLGPNGEFSNYNDPRQIGRWVEKRFDEMGMDLPQEARTMIDAAREGEFPDPVKDL